MTAKTTLTTQLSPAQTALLSEALPGAQTVYVQPTPEVWMPFGPRVTLSLADGAERTVDFRGDIDPGRAALLPVLERMGVPGPRLLHGPVAAGDGWLSLCETPRGENLLLWALGGTPHRIRLATERAFEAVDRLQGATGALIADPLGAALPRRTLSDEVALLMTDELWAADPWLAEAGTERADWLGDPWFRNALARVEAAVADIRDPLVLTSYLHFFPNWDRIQPSGAVIREEDALGPGDGRFEENPLVEFVSPWGHLGDPLLGLAMVWVYDCYPFVHTGYVEQFLWRRDVTRREFAPRLGLKALQMVARDLPVTRPSEGGDYWDGLRGWVQMALDWI